MAYVFFTHLKSHCCYALITAYTVVYSWNREGGSEGGCFY